MDTNIIERNESCCSGSITQTEDKYIKSRSEIIDGIVYNITFSGLGDSKICAVKHLPCDIVPQFVQRTKDGRKRPA